MSETSNITWTESTFNPWVLFPQAFAALPLSLVPNAVRLEVPKFVAWVAKRDAVCNIVSKFRVLAHRLLMVRPQIASANIPAVSAAITIALENSLAPCNVFGRAPQAHVSLKRAVAESVVICATRRPFSRDRGNPRLRRFAVLLPDPVRRPAQRSLAHLQAGFDTHLGAFAHV